MTRMQLHFLKGPALSFLSAMFFFGTMAGAQSMPAQNAVRAQDPDRSSQDQDPRRRELASFDQFLDSHREMAEQIRRDPSLVDNPQFVKDHPALQTYLQDHPGVREELRENPNAFMRQEERFDRREDSRDMDSRRRELASFDQFLDSHREMAEQIRRDPSLVDNPQFVKDHPALQTYLQDHPGVREELRDNPDAFMRQEARYDRQENQWSRGDRNSMRDHSASFGEFLGGHASISEQLSANPSLVKNQDYLRAHPELQEYLTAHPEVRQELMTDPQGFVKASQQFNTHTGVKTNLAPAEPKPKQ
jgi:hypothetical protein